MAAVPPTARNAEVPRLPRVVIASTPVLHSGIHNQKRGICKRRTAGYTESAAAMESTTSAPSAAYCQLPHASFHHSTCMIMSNLLVYRFSEGKGARSGRVGRGRDGAVSWTFIAAPPSRDGGHFRPSSSVFRGKQTRNQSSDMICTTSRHLPCESISINPPLDHVFRPLSNCARPLSTSVLTIKP